MASRFLRRRYGLVNLITERVDLGDESRLTVDHLAEAAEYSIQHERRGGIQNSDDNADGNEKGDHESGERRGSGWHNDSDYQGFGC